MTLQVVGILPVSSSKLTDGQAEKDLLAPLANNNIAKLAKVKRQEHSQR